VGALKSLEQALALLRVIAQSEAVKDARDRVLQRIADQASRLAQSGLVPKVISAPAELVAEIIARRPPTHTVTTDPHHDVADLATPEPTVEIEVPVAQEPPPQPATPARSAVEKPRRATTPPTPPQPPAVRRKTREPKSPAQGAAGGKQAPQRLSKKQREGSKKVRDKDRGLK
jgi:hypothetical protein